MKTKIVAIYNSENLSDTIEDFNDIKSLVKLFSGEKAKTKIVDDCLIVYRGCGTKKAIKDTLTKSKDWDEESLGMMLPSYFPEVEAEVEATFIICVIGDINDSYWKITRTQYDQVLKAKNHQDRIDAIVSGDEASIKSTYDVDVTFDNVDQSQWKNCFKAEWVEWVA